MTTVDYTQLFEFKLPEEPYTTWNHMNYYLSEEEWPAYCKEQGWEHLTEKDRLNICAEDTSDGWDDFIETLSELMDRVNPESDSWLVLGRNHSWRHLNVHDFFTFEQKGEICKGQNLCWKMEWNSSDNRLRVFEYTLPDGKPAFIIENNDHDMRDALYVFIPDEDNGEGTAT